VADERRILYFKKIMSKNCQHNQSPDGVINKGRLIFFGESELGRKEVFYP
jgi:hypothetical protein